MKRVRAITKPTGRKDMRIGDVLLKEVAYKAGDWRVQLTWRDPSRPIGKERQKKWKHNWRAAEAFAEDVDKRLKLLKEKGAGRYTLEDAADSYIKRCEQRLRQKDGELGPDTLDRYRREVEKFIKPKFGHLRLETITSRDIQDWVDEQRENYSYRTVDHQLRVLGYILDWAAERMGCTNPLKLKKVKVPGKRSKRANIPDRSDLERLRQYLTDPRPINKSRLRWASLRVLVLLGASCGMRAGEVAALCWDCIDPVTREIHIKESIARLAGRKKPKTEAGERKVPLTQRAQDIIDEYAVIYKQLEGKCVGSVLRTRDQDHLDPSVVSAWFREVMRETGLVKPGTKVAKFSFHALRHWCASHWMKSTGDVHQVAKWLGHKNASMTLDVYGHCLDDPEAREKFKRMPDWLVPAIEIETPLPVQPVEIMEPLALPAPEESLEFDSTVEVNGHADANDCPIDVPDIAEPWVKPFIQFLAEGMEIEEAYLLIASQMGPSKKTGGAKTILSVGDLVRAEFKRLKLPTPLQLRAGVRAEKILALHAQKYQQLEISRVVGCSQTVVYDVLRSRHKPNANNPLNRKINLPFNNRRNPQPQHKIQLKLL